MKIKNIKILYQTKLYIRTLKFFLIDLVKLIKIKTNLNILFKFIVDIFKKFPNNKNFIKSIYSNSYFEYQDWFQSKIPILIFFLKRKKFHNKSNILEIGSFEGRSTIFFLFFFKNILKLDNFYINCVDTWKGSLEEPHKKIDFKKVEKNFNKNLLKKKAVIRKHKTTSNHFFKNINKNLYDVIFIDGSHKFKDVYSDASYASKVIKKNGLIIFDDYNWFYYKNLFLNPSHAINLFIKKNKINFEILYVGTLFIIRKK